MDDAGIHTSISEPSSSGQREDVIRARLVPFANGIGNSSTTGASFFPSFGRDHKRTSGFANSIDSTNSAISVRGDSHDHHDRLSSRGQVCKVQDTRSSQLSFYKNPDGSGYFTKDHHSLKPLRLSNDIAAKFIPTIPKASEHFSDSLQQNVRPNGDASQCFRGSAEESHSFLNYGGSPAHDRQRDVLSAASQAGDFSTVGEDSTDFLKDDPVISRENPTFKRKQDDTVVALKKAKMTCSTSEDEAGIHGADLPSVDVAGHGNLLLIGNQNMTVNFFSSDQNTSKDNADDKCWDWSGTSKKEIQVENVTDVFRKLADGLAQHVDHKKVARNLEFPDMASLEDDLSNLRNMKNSETDRIFFTLLRWWKSNKFGDNKEVIKEEMGYLLEDLNLTRMRRNIKQYFE